MHNLAAFLLLLCQCRVLCTDSDGLEPLCGHLQAPAIQGHHVPSGLISAGCDCILGCLFCCLGPHRLLAKVDLLWCQHHQPLRVWHPPPPGALLHQHSRQWTGGSHWLLALTLLCMASPSLSQFYFILSSILCISYTEGRSKVFSTCSSHIIVVSVFFGSGAFMYLHPSSVLSMNQKKVFTIFYTVVVPTLNHLIHSFRTKEVKVALRKTLSIKIFFWAGAVVITIIEYSFLSKSFLLLYRVLSHRKKWGIIEILCNRKTLI